MSPDAVLEHPGHPLLVAGQPVVVGGPECDGVAIRCEHPPPRERTCVVVRLTLERLRHLLRHHAAAEDPGKGVADDTLQPALEPLRLAHSDLLSQTAVTGLLRGQPRWYRARPTVRVSCVACPA